ncbi:hypothetical protein D3C86_2078000 [compost metagenome]
MAVGWQAHQQFFAFDANAQFSVHKEAVAAEHGSLFHVAAVRERRAHGVDQVQGFVGEGAGGHGAVRFSWRCAQ